MRRKNPRYSRDKNCLMAADDQGLCPRAAAIELQIHCTLAVHSWEILSLGIYRHYTRYRFFYNAFFYFKMVIIFLL